jgi:hypothetical protein
LNRYTYCHNNPVSYNDPNGHWLHIVVGALIGAVVNTAITAVSDYMDDGQFNSGWKEYAASAAEGAITGAVGAATGGASLLCTATASAAGGMVANAAGQYIRTGEVDIQQAAVAGVIDAGLGVVADIGATKFINSSAGKKIVSKVDDIGNAAKGKIDDFTKQAKTILTNEGGYIKLPFGQVDDVIVDQADDIGLMLYNQGMDNPVNLNPNDISFSQRTVSGNVNNYIDDMKAGNWDWEKSGPLRVMDRDGSLVSYDNRRLMAAQQANLDSVPVQMVKPNDMLPDTSKTWNQAFLDRLNHKWNVKAGGVVPNNGLSNQPEIFVRKKR